MKTPVNGARPEKKAKGTSRNSFGSFARLPGVILAAFCLSLVPAAREVPIVAAGSALHGPPIGGWSPTLNRETKTADAVYSDSRPPVSAQTPNPPDHADESTGSLLGAPEREAHPSGGFWDRPWSPGWVGLFGLGVFGGLLFLLRVGNRKRREAQAALAETETLYRTLVDHIDLGIALVDRNYRLVMTNPAMNRFFAAGSKELRGRHCFQGFEKSDTPCESCPGARAMETGRPVYVETRTRMENGDTLDLAIRAFPIPNGDDPPAGFIEVVQDLSSQKRMERALRSENAFRAGIIECAAEGICVCHEIPEFPFVHFTVWNGRMREITGYTLSEINRKGWYQSLYPDPEVREAARARMARMREGENLRSERWEIATRSGERRPVTISTSVLAGEGETVHVLGLIQDVTGREKAERELRNREADLRTILNSIGDAVIAVDAGHRVGRMNPAAERLTGWIGEEAHGRPLSEVYRIVDEDTRRPPPPDRRTKADARLVLIGRDSTERLVAETVAPLADERGESQGRVFVFRDITERIRLEDRLHQAQKMEAIGQLAGGVAHDFNNMLGGILGAAEMMEIRAGEDPKLRRLIHIIFEGARKASDLTQKLLAFGRKGKVQSTPVDLHEVIRDAVHLLERSIDRRIIICLDLAAPDPVTTGDPAQLQNALLNLGINARDAMPEGGHITIASRIAHFDAPPEWSEGLSVPAGDYVEVTVADTGDGIPEAIRSRVFEPFFTTKETGRGTGLGLAAVFGTLQEHRGGIRLESKPGKGAAFSLYFRHVPDVEPASVPDESEVHRGQGRILLVDDEPIVRAMGEDLLREMGYEVILAVDGREALECFERESGRFDLVILDMVMPRLNGRDTFFALRLADPEVRVLVSSGFSRGLHLREVLDAGAVGFVQKPYTRASLGRLLAEAMP